jgi:hypothetical protein
VRLKGVNRKGLHAEISIAKDTDHQNALKMAIKLKEKASEIQLDCC